MRRENFHMAPPVGKTPPTRHGPSVARVGTIRPHLTRGLSQALRAGAPYPLRFRTLRFGEPRRAKVDLASATYLIGISQIPANSSISPPTTTSGQRLPDIDPPGSRRLDVAKQVATVHIRILLHAT